LSQGGDNFWERLGAYSGNMQQNSVLILVALFCVGFASAVSAQPPVLKARPNLIIISENNCRILSCHWSRSDARFTLGIDVNGRSVAPADLEPGMVWSRFRKGPPLACPKNFKTMIFLSQRVPLGEVPSISQPARSRSMTSFWHQIVTTHGWFLPKI
jgi:hypothetical protein